MNHKATPPSSRVLHAGIACLGIFAAVIARAQADSSSTSSSSNASSQQPIELNPFQVTSDADKGYRAGNSVSATLIETPIKDLPFTISAFTQQFISDINQNDLLGTIRYAPGVSGASSDFTGGNAQYVIDGFPQYPLRNGIPGAYYIADTANIDRVEVVQGPASLLYGAISPGGTVNYITKTAQANPFADITVEAGNHQAFQLGLFRRHAPLTSIFVSEGVLVTTTSIPMDGRVERGPAKLNPSRVGAA